MSYFKHIKQDVEADPNNSSITNLDAAATFVGTSTSTLGVVGLQWSLNTTQNCTVYIEQSPDGTNWDISDSYDYYYSKGGAGGTVQALNSYWRIRVTNIGLITTDHFRLQGVLCPMVESVPRKTSNSGNMQVVASLRGNENTERHVWVNPTNELAVSPVYRMVGTAFDGLILDTNFWTGLLSDGTITQSGGAVHLNTTATASGSATYTSVRKARFVAGSAQLFNCGANFETAFTAGNVRRIGAYDADNGFFFQVSGETFSLGTRKATSDTAINIGDFNGNLGNSWVPVAGTHYLLGIEFTPLMACWYVNGKLLHCKKEAHLSDTLTLPIKIENINTTIEADIELECDGAYIARQGELITNPIYYHLSGNAQAEVILKRGAGVLHKVVYNNTSGTRLTMYDGNVATGKIIGIITTTANAIGVWDYDVPFSNGLAIATVGNSLDATLVYE